MSKLIERFWETIVTKADNERLATQADVTDIFEQCDEPYIDDENQYHVLDVFRPETEKDKVLPTILDIHGGGWYYGTKNLNKKYCFHLAKRGFAVVSPSYRLTPNATFGDMVRDIFAVLKWIDKNAEQFKLDRNNLFITGDSAGGHLTCLTLATMSSQKLQKIFGVQPAPISFNAAALTCAVPNPSKYAKHGIIRSLYFKPLYGDAKKNDAFYKACDFSNNIPLDLPPTFINSCYGDVFKNDNTDLYDELVEKGYETELFFYREQQPAAHKIEHVYSVTQPWWEESEATNDALCNFFKKRIKS